VAPVSRTATAIAIKNLEDDVAMDMACSASTESLDRTSPLIIDSETGIRLSGSRRALWAMGLAAWLQRVFAPFDPILAPEHFAIAHTTRQAEHVSRQCSLPGLLSDRAAKAVI
jgi:hypothetical protein